MTLIVNLYGGPGTGKSTNAALIFGKLKVAGIRSELVSEYAKDLAWEKRDHTLKFQPYVIGKQMHRIYRVHGQVDVIVTDSPILLGAVYKGEGYNEHFEQHLLSTHKNWNTLDIFLRRDPELHPYKNTGRSQTEEEAKDLDTEILEMLQRFKVPYEEIPIQPGESTADEIVDIVQDMRAHDKIKKDLEGQGDVDF